MSRPPLSSALTTTVLILSLLLSTISNSYASSGDSACATGGGSSPSYVRGTGSCAGSIHLRTAIVEVGVHNTFSFGVPHRPPSDYSSNTYSNGAN